jgi:hypothetical protein
MTVQIIRGVKISVEAKVKEKKTKFKKKLGFI